MPGAPNKPPDVAEAPATGPPPGTEARARAVLRRLAPARVTLRLDCWKSGPPPDLSKLVDKAEALYRAADFLNADLALDQFAVRLAEPRWPTIPEPFRRLKVEIPRPQPPQWDPDHALPAPEREAKKARQFAENQLRLAEGSLERATALGVDVGDLRPLVAEAKSRLDTEGATETFWEPVDRLWSAVRERVPSAAPATPVPAPSAKLPPGIAPEEA